MPKTNIPSTLTLTVTAVGNSLGVLLPKEAANRLEVQKGDKIFLTKSPDGYRLTAFDPEFEEEMAIARKGMRKYRDALRELAR
jgi:putative addiction module antidote